MKIGLCNVILICILNCFIFQRACKTCKATETKQKFVKIQLHFYSNVSELIKRLNVSVLEYWRGGQKPVDRFIHMYVYSYSIQYTAYSIQYTVHSTQYTVYSTQHTVYSIQYTAYRIQYTAYSIPYTIYSIQHTVYSIQHTAYSIQHTVYSIQHTVYSIQYTAYSINQQNAPFLISILSFNFWCLLHVSNPRARLQEDSCIDACAAHYAVL